MGTSAVPALSEILLKAKRGLTELTAVDECSFAANGDPAVVEMPSGIEYQVYARALGKPAKKGSDAPKVIFSPKLLGACKWVDDGDGIEEDGELDCLIGLGTTVFDSTGEQLERTKGKNTATDITPLFTISDTAPLWASSETLDVAAPYEEITAADVPLVPYDADSSGSIDEAEFQAFLAANCTDVSGASVFTIADMITYGWDTENWGTTLVNVRFYNKATTTFTP